MQVDSWRRRLSGISFCSSSSRRANACSPLLPSSSVSNLSTTTAPSDPSFSRETFRGGTDQSTVKGTQVSSHSSRVHRRKSGRTESEAHVLHREADRQRPALSRHSKQAQLTSSDSSFSSTFSSTFSGSAAAAAPPAAGAAPVAGAPPPAPTLERRSLTSLPSRALARRVAQMGSTSILAAVVRVLILSACEWTGQPGLPQKGRERKRTVISMPSSARMSAA